MLGDIIGGVVGGLFGADAAADDMARHLAKVKGVDIEELVKAARDRDTQKFQEQLDLLAKADPTFAKLRETGADSLQLMIADSGDNASKRSITYLESLANDPRFDSVVGDLITRAKTEFDAGATLPPEFQAELVRTGLEKAGRAGENLDPTSAAGVRIRRLLGSEGLALQRNRENAATGFLSTADALKTARSNILSNIISGENTAKTGATVRANLARQTDCSSAIPNVGITGEDVGNLQVANQNLKNSVEIMRGKNAAGEQASKWEGLIGGISGAGNQIQSAASSY